MFAKNLPGYFSKILLAKLMIMQYKNEERVYTHVAKKYSWCEKSAG